LQLLGTEGSLEVLFREYAYNACRYFMMDDRFVVFAHNVDTEFLGEG
jgi:hypothetical protein